MTPKTKKIIIILIPIILILIIGIALAILYLTTDFMKSDKTLFLKYAAQNINKFETILNYQDEKEYYEMLNQNKYETSSELTINYTTDVNTSEEDTSHEINNMKVTVNGQADNSNNYNYKNIEILHNDENIFQTEYIHDGDIYGIRFSDIISQFLSIEDNDLKDLAQKLGLSEDIIDKVPNTLDELNLESLLFFTDEQIQELQTRYLTIISNAISDDNCGRQKNALITVGQSSVTTNAYTVTLTKEELNDIYIQLLEGVRDDQTIINKLIEINDIVSFTSSDTFQQDYISYINQEIANIQNNNIGTEQIKFTVYESNGEIVRTAIEESTQTIVIDYGTVEGGNTISIEQTNSNSEQEDNTAIDIIKSSTSSQDQFSINIQSVLGDVTTELEAHRNKTVNGSTIYVDNGITYNDGDDNRTEIAYIENINIVSQIERSTTLDDSNNVILNNYSAEQISEILAIVEEQLNAKLLENQTLISSIMLPGIFNNSSSTVEIQDEGVSEIERNRFNSKYEFYTGEEVTQEKIAELLEVAKDDLSGAQVSYSEDESSTSTSSNKKLQSVRLTMERGTENSELADSVMDLLESESSSSTDYTVTIQYDETTQLVSYITISINE